MERRMVSFIILLLSCLASSAGFVPPAAVQKLSCQLVGSKPSAAALHSTKTLENRVLGPCPDLDTAFSHSTLIPVMKKRPAQEKQFQLQNVGFFLCSEQEQRLLLRDTDQASASLLECMEATNGTELFAASGRAIALRQPHRGSPSPPVLEDALDAEGHTISHWDENSGSTRWALVEPDLAALKTAERDITKSCNCLQRQIVSLKNSNEPAEVERQQLSALRMKASLLRDTIHQYRPEDHHPECIAEGGQGVILVGKDLATGERVAIKVERSRDGESALEREFNALYALRDQEGFPRISHYGRQILNSKPSPTDCRVMVMEMLGSNIHDLWWSTTAGTRGLEVATALALGYQMFGLVERVHAKGYVHRDLKPQNFVMSGGRRGERGCVCLIDFGLAVRGEEQRLRGREEASRTALAAPRFYGTQMYASAGAHEGRAQGPRDDVESLVYVLGFLLSGQLPWGDAGSGECASVGAQKRAAVAGAAGKRTEESDHEGARREAGAAAQGGGMLQCKDAAAGKALDRLLSHCRALKLEDTPDYAYCKGVILEAYKAVAGSQDILQHKWEWLCPRGREERRQPLDFMDLM